MKTLIYKELRENLKLGVPVLLVLTAFFTFAAWDVDANVLLGTTNLRLTSLVYAG